MYIIKYQFSQVLNQKNASSRNNFGWKKAHKKQVSNSGALSIEKRIKKY